MTSAPRSHPQQLLLVDDEPHVRLFVRKILEQLGYTQVAEAGTPEEALKLFRDFAFDGVLLDLGLPGKTGLEVMPELWAIDPDVPVIVVTAQVQATLVKQCLEAGAVGYVVKSGPLENVRASLREALERVFAEDDDGGPAASA